MLGLISLSLAHLNLLPLLPLDGGHILVSLIEAARRRAVPQRIYQRASTLGMALILVVTVLALGNDLNSVPR